MRQAVTVVYIDSLFVINLIINYLLLLATAKLCALAAKRWRLALGACVGALYAVAAFLPHMDALTSLLGKVLSCAFIVVIAVGWHDRTLRAGLVFVAVGFAFGGCVLAVNLLTRQSAGVLRNGVPYMAIDARLLVLTSAAFYLLLTLVFRGMARFGRRDTAQLTITLDGKQVSVNALHDSGNLLTDPVSGAPILIVDAHHLLPLWPREARSLLTGSDLHDPTTVMLALNALQLPVKFRLVPYKTIGSNTNFLLAFRPAGVTLNAKKQHDLLVALSPTPVGNGVYAAVVNVP